MKIYLVLWGGGYENPQLAFCQTAKEADLLAKSWAVDATPEDGTSISIYEVDPECCAVDGQTVVY